MYGSYGSYSSMSASSINASAPMEIPGSSSSQASNCAFPSWPRRSSLDTEEQERPSAFLSDDDLNFVCDPFTDDDVHSISSGSSNSTSPAQQQNMIGDAQLVDMERHRLALQREYVRQVVSEKERRRQQQVKRAQASRRSHSSKKSSPKSKLGAMTPITEAI